MMKKFFSILVGSLIISSAFAATPPDIKGVWSGTTNDAIIGSGIYYSASSSPDQIRFLQLPITYNITQQSGRNFSGEIQLGNKKFPMVGVFAADLVSGVFAEKGGTGTFAMAGSNQINFCWSTSSTDPSNKAAGAVVSCHELVKK
jgi:hypothetical protein